MDWEWIQQLSVVAIVIVILATIVTILVLASRNQETTASRSAVTVTLIMEGDVAQVTAEDTRKAVETVARTLGVDPSQVAVEVTSGSIVFRFTVTTDRPDAVRNKARQTSAAAWTEELDAALSFPVRVTQVAVKADDGIADDQGGDVGDGDQSFDDEIKGGDEDADTIPPDPCASSIGVPPMSDEPEVDLPVTAYRYEDGIAMISTRDAAGVMAVLAKDADFKQPIEPMEFGDTFYIHFFGHTGNQPLTSFSLRLFLDEDVCHCVPVQGKAYSTSYLGHCEAQIGGQVGLCKRAEIPSNYGEYKVAYMKLQFSAMNGDHAYLGHVKLKCVGFGQCVAHSGVDAYFHSNNTAFIEDVYKGDMIEMKNNTVQLKETWKWQNFWDNVADAQPSDNLGHTKVAFALNADAHPTKARIDVFRFPARHGASIDTNLSVQARLDARYFDAWDVDFQTPSQLEIASEVVDVADGLFTLRMSRSQLLQGGGVTYVGTMRIPLKCMQPSSEAQITTILRLTLGDEHACFALLLMHRECGCQIVRMARISKSVADAVVDFL